MSEHLVLLPDEGPGRASASRAVLRHLQAGRSAFIFPAGTLVTVLIVVIILAAMGRI